MHEYPSTEPLPPVVLGPWPVGMNNRKEGYKLPPGAASNIVNVDLDDTGNARRRAGYTKIVSGLNTRAGYSCDVGTFYISGTNLMRLNDDNTSTALFSGVLGEVVAFECSNGVVYFTDGLITKRIVNGVVTSWDIDAHLAADPEYMAVPAGSIVREFYGRVYVAVGKVVWFTDPFMLGSVQKQRNFIQFPADVTIMEPVSGGIWFVADQTYFYAGGGPDEFMPKSQLNYGAVPGTSIKVPYTNDVMWYSVRGAVVGTQDGQIKNIQEANIAAESGTVGTTLIREENGIKQFIASIKNQGVSPLATTSWMDMEVIRKAGE